MSDSSKRTIIKSLTFRLVSAISSFILIYCLTGSLKFSTTFIAIDSIIKTILYYIHEKSWMKTKWGKIKKNDKTSKSKHNLFTTR